MFASQHGAAGGEDPEGVGPAGEGRQRLLRPLREDLPTAGQEEEIPDKGATPPILLPKMPACTLAPKTSVFMLRERTEELCSAAHGRASG